MKKRKVVPVIIVAIIAGLIVFGILSCIVINLMRTHRSDANNDFPEYEEEMALEYSDYEEDSIEEEDIFEDEDYLEEETSFTMTRNWKPVNDSTLKISYEMETEESPAYVYDEEPVTLGDETDYYSTFILSFSEDVSYVQIHDLKSDIDDDGSLIITELDPSDEIEEVKANTPVYFYLGDLGETVPFMGFSLMDSEYRTHHFYFQISGKDGSAIVEEYDCSYINVDYYDIVNEDLPAAHLRGFNSIQEAIEHYDREDYVPEWSVLWVVVPKIDADGTDASGNLIHDTVEMTKDEVDFYMNDMPYQFRDSVEELSLSHVKINIDTLLYEKPITELASWNDIRKDCFDDNIQADFQKYNSVICCVKLSDGDESGYNVDWLGLGYGLEDTSYGFCEVDIASTYDYDRDSKNVYPAEPWIHEWIHTLQPNGHICGIEVGNPDEAEKHGYKCKGNGLPINGFYEYYGDILSGKIEGGYGFTEGMWRTLSKLYSETRK